MIHILQTEISDKKIRSVLTPLLWAVFIIYMAVLFYVTLLAWNYGASFGPQGPGGRNYNLVPFRSIYRIAVFSPGLADPLRILAGNIVLFIPFGFILGLLSRKKSRAVLTITFAAMLVSTFIEVNQFIFTHRVANIDDVILNTLGALIGVIAAIFIGFLLRRVIWISVKNRQ
ncbi:VanZ family protein [Bacillus sp. FJAT-44742]|uniref:VanZ family protein n=1 Tax=Bacillus sp. FJAT-44742 TaxID=2014005 RepID=UPI001E57D74F|nr:VanZ family protein [Bacillus sp. FJAT-44742]